MARVSGRAGLFTIKTFNPNLTEQVEATTRGQKSGALRLEFGKLLVADATVTMVSTLTTIVTGIMAVATPTKVGTPTGIAASSANAHSGAFGIACSGSFLSGVFNIDIVTTGSYSGQASGMEINYMIVGY